MAKSLSKNAALHDIPLAVDESVDTMPEPQKNNSKTNSLKRFFKMPNKRHTGGEEMATVSRKHDIELEATNKDKEDEIQEIDGSDGSNASGNKEEGREKPKKDYSKRFHLRLGGMNRIVHQADSGSFMPGSTSRQTLKNSLSTYWNSMFGRPGKKNELKITKRTEEDDEADAEEEANETEIREEVHTLPISEDNGKGLGAKPKE